MSGRKFPIGAGLVMAGALLLAVWARYGLIESSALSALCFARASDATNMPLQCLVRGWFVTGVGTPIPGVAAVMAGLAAVTTRRRDATMLALACGGAGIVLYAGMPAAAGLLCGWITLARGWRAAQPVRG